MSYKNKRYPKFKIKQPAKIYQKKKCKQNTTCSDHIIITKWNSRKKQ